MLSGIAIKGTLKFAQDKDTLLTVGTILQYQTGSVVINTPKEFTTEVVFYGAMNLDTDPGQFTIGYNTIGGTADIRGREVVKHFTTLTSALKGETTITVTGSPDWRVGDELYLQDTQIDGTKYRNSILQGEYVIIAAIDGNNVTLTSPLKYNHMPLLQYEHHTPLVMHITRNVIFRTHPDSPDRGHILFSADTDTTVLHARLEQLGRTNINKTHDTLRNDLGQVTQIGLNQRARYPLHAHHLGSPFEWEGNVIISNPKIHRTKWGIVNHDSFGSIKRNIVIGLSAAGIVGEDGPETGEVSYNVVVGRGGGDSKAGQFDAQGRGGFGYWFRGPLLNVHDNHAIGYFTNAAYNYSPTDFIGTVNLKVPDISGSTSVHRGKIVNIQTTPITFRDNWADILGGKGLILWDSKAKNTLENFVVYLRRSHNRGARPVVFSLYTKQIIVLSNPQIYGTGTSNSIGSTHGAGFNIIGGRIENLGAGISISRYQDRTQLIKDVYLNNKINILVDDLPNESRRTNDVVIENVTFGENQTNIKMSRSRMMRGLNKRKQTDEEYRARWLRSQLKNHRIIVKNYNGTGKDFMTSYKEMHPDYYVERLGTTNQELFDLYGKPKPGEIVFQGEELGIDGHTHPIAALDIVPKFRKYSPVYTPRNSYAISYSLHENGFAPHDWKYIRTVHKTGISLDPGFNTIPLTIEGEKFNLFAYADYIPETSGIIIKSPREGSTITGTNVKIYYAQAGDLTNVDHAHFTLDDRPEIMDTDYDGHYTFVDVAYGEHTLIGWLTDVLHQKIPGTEKTVSFTTTAKVVTEEPPAPFEPGCTADLNQDGIVNSFDWLVMKQSWGGAGVVLYTVGEIACSADLNNDGVVNSLDWTLVKQQWGTPGSVIK